MSGQKTTTRIVEYSRLWDERTLPYRGRGKELAAAGDNLYGDLY